MSKRKFKIKYNENTNTFLYEKKVYSKDNLTLERVQNHRKLSAYLVGKVCVEYLRIYNSLLD